VVEGEILLAGTDIGVSAYSIHHNETYFPDSFIFKPERWLADEPSSQDDSKTGKTNMVTAVGFHTVRGWENESCWDISRLPGDGDCAWEDDLVIRHAFRAYVDTW
jgi:hypothetical protein